MKKIYEQTMQEIYVPARSLSTLFAVFCRQKCEIHQAKVTFFTKKCCFLTLGRAKWLAPIKCYSSHVVGMVYSSYQAILS